MFLAGLAGGHRRSIKDRKILTSRPATWGLAPLVLQNVRFWQAPGYALFCCGVTDCAGEVHIGICNAYWRPLLAAVNPASRCSNPAMSRLAREDIGPA